VFNLGDIYFIKKNTLSSIDISDKLGYSIEPSEKFDPNHIKEIENIFDRYENNEFNERSIIPNHYYFGEILKVESQSATFYFWLNESLDLILVVKNTFNQSINWILNVSSYVLSQGREVFVEELLDIRYLNLTLTSSKEKPTMDQIDDLFETIPESYFFARRSWTHFEPNYFKILVETTPPDNIFEFIPYISKFFDFLQNDDCDTNTMVIDYIIKLISNNFINLDVIDPRERILIMLNMIYSFSYIDLDEDDLVKILNFAAIIETKINEIGYQNGDNILKLLLTSKFNQSYDLKYYSWISFKIPSRLLLLPRLLKKFENIEKLNTMDQLSDLMNFNIQVLSHHVLYDGLESLQIKLAEMLLAEADYRNAANYFNQAADLFKHRQLISKSKDYRIKSIQANLDQFMELCISSNYFFYSSRKIESINLAWSALKIALIIIIKCVKYEISYLNYLTTIKQYFQHARRP